MRLVGIPSVQPKAETAKPLKLRVLKQGVYSCLSHTASIKLGTRERKSIISLCLMALGRRIAFVNLLSPVVSKEDKDKGTGLERQISV